MPVSSFACTTAIWRMSYEMSLYFKKYLHSYFIQLLFMDLWSLSDCPEHLMLFHHKKMSGDDQWLVETSWTAVLFWFSEIRRWDKIPMIRIIKVLICLISMQFLRYKYVVLTNNQICNWIWTSEGWEFVCIIDCLQTEWKTEWMCVFHLYSLLAALQRNTFISWVFMRSWSTTLPTWWVKHRDKNDKV